MRKSLKKTTMITVKMILQMCDSLEEIRHPDVIDNHESLLQ